MGKKIEILEVEGNKDEKAALPTLGKARIKTTQVDMSILSANLKEVLAEFQQVVEDQPMTASGYYLDEIELSLGVSGNGSIFLLGKVEAGVQASIKVKIKRENKG